MIRTRLAAAAFLVLVFTTAGAAQTVVESNSPTLAELLRNIYGSRGLTVDSEAVLPDGSTHSGHFNGAFQSEFERFNIALVRQLVALPVPSPASGFTYSFDESTGTFTRSTQSFGPILSDRAETIGRGKFAFGFSFRSSRFKPSTACVSATFRPSSRTTMRSSVADARTSSRPRTRCRRR